MKRFALFLFGLLLMITLSGCTTTTRSAYNETTYYKNDNVQSYSSQDNGDRAYGYQYTNNNADYSVHDENAYYTYATDDGVSDKNAMYSLSDYVYDNDPVYHEPASGLCDLNKLKSYNDASKVRKTKYKKVKKVKKVKSKTKTKRTKSCGCKLRHAAS